MKPIKRRLLLAREIALSPAEIKKSAKKAGFTDEPEVQPELAKVTAPTKDKTVPATVADVQPKPIIVKTASVTAASSAPVTAVYSKTDKSLAQVKRTTSAAE